jgi:prevent-host-death family protein
MCYMSSEVNVRELRQNLSRYLDRVAAGETLRVLERGRAVAVLAPLPERATPLERLVASGRAKPAALDFLRLGPPARATRKPSISAALSEQRDER